MADCAFDRLVLRSSSVVSLNDRFSPALRGPACGDVKREPPVEHLCCELEVRTVQPPKSVQQRLTRVAPGPQRPGPQRGGPQPRALTPGPSPPGGPLSSAALEGRFLGGRRCPCALWGLRLLSRRYGWAGRVLRARALGARPLGARPPGARPPGARPPGARPLAARPLRRAGFTPNRWRYQRSVPSKEELDQQLDDYMSMSKSRLDAQLDAYRALAGGPDADHDDRKLYDSDE